MVVGSTNENLKNIMRKFINKVTVTGADDSLDPRELLSIAQEYPFVEFGILLSEKMEGTDRFPSSLWLETFLTVFAHQNYNVAGHICGKWVKDILEFEFPTGLFHMDNPVFRRWQLNTHGYKHKFTPGSVFSFLNQRIIQTGANVIFQWDDANPELMNVACNSIYSNCSVLFDGSHGAGVEPDSWPEPREEVYCGYAGGLHPDRIGEQIEAISKVVPEGRRIWIDAETHLRSDDNEIFDLKKVRKFLAGTLNYVC
jgi:hypothetical protein